ncbi:hypothetical protein [Pollutibacter soli]|uniref:hypothetical protein n=1 Tax=Pollutibacter soli TaxID=3034157 RepID=UPI003013549E
MNRYAQLFYILFFLLIMGAFASMAQNSYGLTILGLVGITFAIIFLWRGISQIRAKGPKKTFAIIEMFCLAIISVLLALRVFYFRIPGTEILLALVSLLLILVYARRMMRLSREMMYEQPKLAYPVIAFYSSLMLFLLALLLMPLHEPSAEVIGTIAFVVLLADIIYCTFSGTAIVKGKTESGFSIIFKLKDHSLLIASIFFLFSIYLGLNRMGVLPGLYSDEYPQAYFELVNEATTGEDQPQNGAYQYQQFKTGYEDFVKRIATEKEQ